MAGAKENTKKGHVFWGQAALPASGNSGDYRDHVQCRQRNCVKVYTLIQEKLLPIFSSDLISDLFIKAEHLQELYRQK